VAFGFLKKFIGQFQSRPVDWEDLEEALIRGDLGVPLSLKIIERLRELGSEVNGETVLEVTRKELIELFPRALPPLRPHPSRPRTILMLGVNGTGKTTSSAKLAAWLKQHQHSVLLAAADTFRAAAIEQLESWGQKLEIEVIAGQYQGDSAALCYDAWQAADRRQIEFLICDTAGRLHTKSNLMQELAKIPRTLAKHHPDAPEEKWLVVDASTGMNGLVQAREFHQAVGLTGIVMTKIDGSGKGGIAAAIQHELGLSPRFLGFGEKATDWQPFEREAFVANLI
jgi:fused signal recognition particle receptor